MDRTEATRRILEFAASKEGLNSRAVGSALQYVVPPQVDAMFLTHEVEERPGDVSPAVLADVGLLSHDGWFVGVSVYTTTIRSTEFRVADVREMEQTFGEVFWDVSFSLSGFQEGFYLRARTDNWKDLGAFLNSIRQKMRG